MSDPIGDQLHEAWATEEMQKRMDSLVDQVLDLIEEAAREGVNIDPLQTILTRLQARGQGVDLSQADPMTRMLLGGMLG